MRRLLPLVTLLAVACVGTSEPASGDVRSCAARPYSYAGFAAAQPASGVSATVTAVCNAFAYRFGTVAAAAAGKWITFARGYRFQDPGYRVVADSSTTFRALGN